MNLQAYQQCISSLEKQIASRQQQRQQMAMTIQQLDSHLESQVNCNRAIKQQINMLSRSNYELQQLLHQKLPIIEHQQNIINESIEKDKFMQQKITMLETQKKNLQQELVGRDGVIAEMMKKVSELQADNGKNGSLIEGYRNVVNQKAKQCAQLQSRLTRMSQQNSNLTTQINKARTQHQQQKQELQQKATSTIQQLRLKIISLVQQMQQLKQIQSSQLNTIEFTHGQQVDQLKKQQRFLRGEIVHYLQVIDELKQQLQQNRLQLIKAKQQCQRFNLSKDQIVNQLINEINFLKQEKVEIQKKSSLQLQSITQEIFKIGLEKVVYQQKQKQLQQKINQHQQHANNLQTKFKQLNIEHNKLSFEKDLCLQRLESEKSVTFQKDEEINKLKLQLERVNKVIEGMKKQKQTINTNSSMELTILRQHNIDLERSLLAIQGELQQKRIHSIQLEQQIKQLAYDKIKLQKTIDELIKIVENQQSTLLNLQSLLEQSNKVITELNLTVTTKLQEIQALQNSNHIFRRQKLQWLHKQEEYRKRANQLKTVKSTQRLNRASTEYCVSSRSQSRLKTIHQGYNRSNMVNRRGYQKLQHVYSMSVINNGQDSVQMPFSWLQRMGLANQQQTPYFVIPYNQNNTPCYQSSSSNEQSPLQQQNSQLHTQAQKFEKKSRLKSSQSHQVDLSTFPHQTMKKKDKKLEYAIQNGKANHNYVLKKDYSVGKIHTRNQSG